MFRLAGELVRDGKKVITTTTTKILEPASTESPCVLVALGFEEIRKFLEQNLSKFGHITVAAERLQSKKLKGISLEIINSLWALTEVDFMIIEADGAAGRPVKAPREGEPVIAPETTVTVALLGIDGAGVPVREESVFRSEQVSQLTGLPIGAPLTTAAMAVLVTDPKGIFKGTPASSRRVFVINKVDIKNGLEKAKGLARLIFDTKPPIERVALARLKGKSPVAAIFLPQARAPEH